MGIFTKFRLPRRFAPRNDKNMNKKYKALIIDIDGTLMASIRDGLPTTKVTEALRKAAKLLHVGIATQRTMASVIPVIKHLNLSGPSIIAGGAQVIDSKTLKVIREEEIGIDDLKQVIKIVNQFRKKHDVPFVIHDNEEKDEVWTDAYIPHKPMMAFVGNLDFNQAGELEDKLSKIDSISVHKVEPWNGKFGVVVNAALATKQHGIFEVAKILKINTHEIIGVGDSYNDFPLLMACGLKVAMGNAIDDLKEIADYIAPSVEEDGVADVINKFIL